ncbi:hypothetical protein AC579_1087 [Pseudocercospora musae]|uniref:Uncharacterized protein n=1 Tax=Pseudocercospora musae TaxID=113226 RepID=A0A139H821_9PEZI|nr:hypothetical protein AC579_1087 [Pseudocercospora musae]
MLWDDTGSGSPWSANECGAYRACSTRMHRRPMHPYSVPVDYRGMTMDKGVFGISKEDFTPALTCSPTLAPAFLTLYSSTSPSTIIAQLRSLQRQTIQVPSRPLHRLHTSCPAYHLEPCFPQIRHTQQPTYSLFRLSKSIDFSSGAIKNRSSKKCSFADNRQKKQPFSTLRRRSHGKEAARFKLKRKIKISYPSRLRIRWLFPSPHSPTAVTYVATLRKWIS